MATPTLTRRTLPGGLGPILVDVRAPASAGSRPAVILLHGFKGFKDFAMFPPFAERLARAGFTAVSMSASGSGVDQSGEFVWPERFGHNTFSLELADLLSVIGALDRGELGGARPTSIGVVGHSRGGGTAILAASRNLRIGALVTWASISTVVRWTEAQRAEWRRNGAIPILNTRTRQTLPLYTETLDDVERDSGGTLDIQGAAARLTVPWLVIHGTADESVPFEESQELVRVAPKQTTHLLAIEAAGHSFGAGHPFAGPTPALETVFNQSAAWLAKHLP